MEENKNQQSPKQNNGDMGTSENSNDVQNPINTGSKSENSGNDTATAMSRNPTDRGSAGLGSKSNVTGSDFDGQVSR
ncbi:MAG: hypothetical protein M3Q06_09795 [Bacteroidota bacterium]|nr:hypothetical protein [Bacteroidota bacterium]